MTSTACYVNSFTFLHADDVRTSQETPLWSSTALYGYSFIFYMQMMFVPHSKHPMTSTACYVNNFTFLHADDVRTLQETPLWSSTACYGYSFIFYMQMMFEPHSKHPNDFHGLLRTPLYFLYANDARTSQETPLRTSTSCYGDSFTLLFFTVFICCNVPFIVRVSLCASFLRAY
jgi:hypothetical protein